MLFHEFIHTVQTNRSQDMYLILFGNNNSDTFPEKCRGTELVNACH